MLNRVYIRADGRLFEAWDTHIDEELVDYGGCMNRGIILHKDKARLLHYR